MKKYKIVPEKMGGVRYYMIYKRGWILWSFYERWNTPETAKTRLTELTCS
jgi:hypothetical protein